MVIRMGCTFLPPFFLVWLIASTSARDFGYSPEDLLSVYRTVSLYESWLAKHNKAYTLAEAKQQRYKIFKDNLIYIDEVNQKNLSYWLGINKYADLSHDEFKSTYLSNVPQRFTNPTGFLLKQKRDGSSSNVKQVYFIIGGPAFARGRLAGRSQWTDKQSETQPTAVHCIWALIIVLLMVDLSSVDALIASRKLQRIIHKINRHGPYLGIVVPNAFEMDPLLQSSSFNVSKTLDIAGRRFHKGSVHKHRVIIVMSRLAMLNSGLTTQLLLANVARNGSNSRI